SLRYFPQRPVHRRNELFSGTTRVRVWASTRVDVENMGVIVSNRRQSPTIGGRFQWVHPLYPRRFFFVSSSIAMFNIIFWSFLKLSSISSGFLWDFFWDIRGISLISTISF